MTNPAYAVILESDCMLSCLGVYPGLAAAVGEAYMDVQIYCDDGFDDYLMMTTLIPEDKNECPAKDFYFHVSKGTGETGDKVTYHILEVVDNGLEDKDDCK